MVQWKTIAVGEIMPNNERQKLIQKAKDESDVYTYAVLTGMEQMDKDIKELNTLMTSGYATKSEMSALDQRLKMVEKIVYGLVTITLLTVFGALLALVIRQ